MQWPVCTLKVINLVNAEVNILLLSGDKVHSGRFWRLCLCSFNTQMRWPFMVAFAMFNAFIFTKPLTTVNQSLRAGNVSYG